MNNIQKSMYHLKSLYEELDSNVSFDINKEIKSLTKLSYKKNQIKNLVNIINLERKTIDISNYKFIKDYNIETYSKYTPDGLSFKDEDEYNDYIEDKYDYVLWENLEIEYDEIYWYIVFNFGEEIDIDIAKKVGLGVLTINSTGEQFLFFKSCGMDMSYLVIEYLSLTYGAITSDYLNKLNYCKHILSKEKFNNLIQMLGVDTTKLYLEK